jgi:hypothetical protein
MATVEQIDALYINLKILAKLGNHQRLNARAELLAIEPAHWYLPLARYFRGDNRSITVKRIDELVSGCVAFLAAHGTTEHEAVTMHAHLAAAEAGMRNLMETYAADATMTSSLERIVDKIINITGGSTTREEEEEVYKYGSDDDR